MQMSIGATTVTVSCGPIWIPKAEKSGKRQKVRKTMKEKLIFAVSGFPELLRTLWTQMGQRQRALCFHRKYEDSTLPRVRSMVKEGTDV